MRIWMIAALVAVSCGELTAQGTTNGEARQRVERQVRTQIRNMRRAMKDGVPVRTNVQVKVKLRNGNKLTGVVRNGRFVERYRKLDFETADKGAAGAGIRVWYYDNTTSYIFLPFEEIATYKIGKRLTNVQVAEIEKRIAKSEAEARARHAQALAGRQRGKSNARQRAEQRQSEAAERESAAAAKKREAEDQRLLKLVVEYPPEEGWGPDRLRDIQIRKMTVGSFPDERSKRFIEIFDDWQKGYALRQKREREGTDIKPIQTSDDQSSAGSESATGAAGGSTKSGKAGTSGADAGKSTSTTGKGDQ